jgi:L-iditol 2-dehydrogenase
MNTKAGYLRAPWEVELRDVSLPDEAPPGELLLKVEACGICGTDLSAAAASAKKWESFGHEVAGVIESVGSGVTHLKAGQRVVLETSSFLPYSAASRNGRVDLCNRAPGFWGRAAMGFSHYMVVPAGCAVPYEGLTPDVASLAEPAGVAYDMVRTANVTLGDRVALIGPGPIALMAIPMLLRSGARQVVCIGRSTNTLRLDLARKLGAEAVVHDGPLSTLAELQRSFEHVLVTAPVGILPEALSLLSYGGELTYIGIGTGSGNITFDANDFHFRKLQLRASFASPALYFPVVLDLLKPGILPGESFISHRFSLEQLAEAMYLHRDSKDKVLKVIVTM